MQVRFTEEQTSQFIDAKQKYMAAVTKIMSRPDHHSFDALNAYIREIDKIFNIIMTSVQDREKEISAELMKAIDNDDESALDGLEDTFNHPERVTQELRTQINQYFSGDVEVNKLDAKYKEIEPRITGFIFQGDVDDVMKKRAMDFLSKGVSILKKSYGVTFSDDSTLTWNPLGSAIELAAARSELSHKMDYLADDNQSTLTLK